ncbi:MAG: hypothetical protein AABZ14_08590, partial [Candidatus Margulisiibacteriota bacterium]
MMGRNYTNSGTLSAGTTQVIEFNGTGSQFVATEQNFGNVAITNTVGNVTSTGHTRTFGDLIINSGARYGISTGQLTVSSSTSMRGTLTTVGGVSFTGAVTTTGAFNQNSTATFANTWEKSTTGVYNGTATSTFSGSAAQRLPVGVTLGGLIVNKSAETLTLGGDATSTAGVTLTAGTFSMGTSTLSVTGGNWSNGGATFQRVNGTILFYGSDSPTFNESSLYHLTINKTVGTVTLSNAATSTGRVAVIAGDLTLTNGTVLELNGDTTPLVVTGTLTPGTASIRYATTTAMNVAAINHHILTLGSTGTYTVTASTTARNDFNLSGGTLTLGSNVLYVGGNITNGGTIATGTTGAIELNGGGAQTFPTFTLDNLNVRKPANTATFSGHVTSTGAVRVSQGELSLGGQTLVLVGDTRPLVMNGGTLTPASGVVTYSTGTGITMTVASTTYYDLITRGSGTYAIDASTTAMNDVEVAGGTLNPGSNILYMGRNWVTASAGLTTGVTGGVALNG